MGTLSMYPILKASLQRMSKLARIPAVALSAGVISIASTRAEAQDVGFFPHTTYKIVQMTGETDWPRRIPTVSRTYANECVRGTDLGSSFEHNGHLYFLFGDTPSLPNGNNADDFLAWTDASRAEDVFLNVYHDPQDGCVHRIAIPGVDMADFEVPSGGISLASGIYIVATTDHTSSTAMGRSVMAVSHDDGYSFQQLYDLSTLSQTGHFINVSMVEVDGRLFPGLPPEPCVLIWGTGAYRLSDVRLAYVPSAQISNKAAIRYFKGLADNPWSPDETNTVSLFDPSEQVVGEFSVAYCQPLAKWIMLYNALAPGSDYTLAQIKMRSASLPWGWSQPTVIFDPAQDKAFSTYMHVPGKDIIADHAQSDADLAGGVYGPYLIPRFFQGDQNRVTIVYTMSTWNPYQVILMQSDIGYPDRVPPENISSLVTLPGDTRWTVFPSNLLHGFLRNGIPCVTTYGDNGDADMGVAQYGFLAGSCDQALEFAVHGGDAEVVLIEQTQSVPAAPADVPAFYTALKAGSYGRVVETIIGPQSNDHELAVRWDLRRHRGKMMRLFVVDWLNRPWGFISVSQVTRFFVAGNDPVNIYVDRSNTAGPFLGTPDAPFQTVTAGYNAAIDSACSANVLKIRAGNYPETPTMNEPVTLNAEGGTVTIGH